MQREKRQRIGKVMARGFDKPPTPMTKKEMKERLDFIPILLNRLSIKDQKDPQVIFATEYWLNEKRRLEEELLW